MNRAALRFLSNAQYPPFQNFAFTFATLGTSMKSWLDRHIAALALFHQAHIYFRTSCTAQFKCDGTRAETRFRLSAKRASPFKSAGASVQSTTGSRGVRISGSNAGYIMFQGSVMSTGYPLHSHVSPSLPLPCVAMCRHISTGLYKPNANQTGLQELRNNNSRREYKDQALTTVTQRISSYLHKAPHTRAKEGTPLIRGNQDRQLVLGIRKVDVNISNRANWHFLG